MKKLNRRKIISMCKEIDIENIDTHGLTKKKINEFYSNISNKELLKVFDEYYGLEDFKSEIDQKLFEKEEEKSMAKYNVSLCYYKEFEVEADDEQEAIDKARCGDVISVGRFNACPELDLAELCVGV